MVAGRLKIRRKKLREKKQWIIIITVGDSFSPQNSSPKGELHYIFKHLQPRKRLIGKMPAESKRTLTLSCQQGVEGGVNVTSNTGTR